MFYRSIDPDMVWADIEGYTIQIYQRISLPKARLIELHERIYTYCMVRHQPTGSLVFQHHDTVAAGEDLYHKFQRFFKNYSMNLLDASKDLHDDELLKYYTENWKTYKLSSEELNTVCTYFNGNWVARKRTNAKKTFYKIYDLAVVSWRENLFKILDEQIRNIVLKFIERERNGETISTTLIFSVISSFVDLGFHETDPKADGPHLNVYKKYFEDIFIEDTKKFYRKESEEFLGSHSNSEYMEMVEQRLREEHQRATFYLHESTSKRLLETCGQVLIHNHIHIFKTEFQRFLNEDKALDLEQMYCFISRVPDSLKELQIALENHVHNFGIAAIEKLRYVECNDGEVYIERSLNVYNKYRNLVAKSFHDDIDFIAAVEKGCTKFINKNPIAVAENSSSGTPELLAKYCDLLLKKSNKTKEDTDLEDKLAQIRKIFAFVDDKDEFLKFYSKMLARRLVYQNAGSDFAEASMISIFKDECGYGYISNLQNMFREISISANLNDNFKEYLVNSNMTSDSDFNIVVLCSRTWPFSQNCSFSVPSVLERSVLRFNTFYSGQFSGRKLVWMHNMSKVEIVTNCFKNSYTIQASILQLDVLLQFNDQTNLTVKQLVESTGIALGTLIQILKILLKSKLLTCADAEDKLTSDSIVKLFLGYKNRKLRININVPLKAEKKIEQDETLQHVERDRKCLIEAAIVRIMKQNKTLDHNSLVAELLRELAPKFKAKVVNIKRTIDLLIEKGYIEKAMGQKDKYNYLA